MAGMFAAGKKENLVIPEKRLKEIATSGTNCFKNSTPQEGRNMAKEILDNRIHQAQRIYPGNASFDFHAGNSQTGFQADGFQVIVNHHVIAECEDSEVADFICKAWNEMLAHKMALDLLADALVTKRS